MGAAYGHLGVGSACAGCGHNAAKHAVPGLDGECIQCDRCPSFVPREQPATEKTAQPVRVLVGVPWAQISEIDDTPHRRGARTTPDRTTRRKESA